MSKYEEETKEKRRIQNTRVLEVDVKQATVNDTDKRIGDYEKTEIGSGTLVGDNPETSSPDPDGNRSSVAKRKSPRRRINKRDMSSTHTVEFSENRDHAISQASGGNNRMDPMLKL